MENGKNLTEKTEIDVRYWPLVIYCQGCLTLKPKYLGNDVFCAACLRDFSEGWPEVDT
jgi:hypothetical protein